MCCTGQEIQYKDIMPPELQNLRRQLTGITSNKVEGGITATPLPKGMPLSAPVNPASMAALNIMMGMMGQGGYTQPQFITYGYGQPNQPFYRDTPPDTEGGKLPPGWMFGSNNIPKSKVKKSQLQNPYLPRRG